MDKKDKKIVRQTLDLLLEKANSLEDLEVIKFAIDDYIEQGYYVKKQIQNYNDKVKKFRNRYNQMT